MNFHVHVHVHTCMLQLVSWKIHWATLWNSALISGLSDTNCNHMTALFIDKFVNSMGYWYVTDVSSLGAGNFITCRGHIAHLQNKDHILHIFTCVAGIHGDSRKQLSCMGYNFMTLSRFIYPLTLFATAFCCRVFCDRQNAKRTENSYCRTCHVQVF